MARQKRPSKQTIIALALVAAAHAVRGEVPATLNSNHVPKLPSSIVPFKEVQKTAVELMKNAANKVNQDSFRCTYTDDNYRKKFMESNAAYKQRINRMNSVC